MPERLRQRSAVSYVAVEEQWVEDDEVLPAAEQQEEDKAEGEVRASLASMAGRMEQAAS